MLWSEPARRFRVAAVEAVPDQPEQGLHALVDVPAVQGLVAREAHELQIAQVLQAVALAVRLGVYGGIAELRTRLDVEQEQQAVHVAQGFEGQLPGELVVESVHALLADFAQIPDGLVADELDAFAERMLEVRRDGEGVLVAVVVQGVVQAHTFGGEEAVTVEEGGGGLQGGRLTSAQDVVENESQQEVVGPLAPFKQQDLAGREEHHPTCRMLRSEDAARDDVVPGRLEQPLGRRGLAVVLRPVRPERKRIFVFPVGVVGAEDEKLRRSVSDAGGVEHGDLVPVVPAVASTSRIVQGVVRGLEIVTERSEEQAEPVALQLDAG